MSIARISDTRAINLPTTILAAIRDDKTNDLDTSVFDSKSLRMRDIISRVFPVMGIIDMKDIDRELSAYTSDQLSLRNKRILLVAIMEAVKHSASLAVKVSSSDLESALGAIINDNSLNTVQQVQKIKSFFSKTFYLTDSDKIVPGGYIFISGNYSGIVTQISSRVNSKLKTYKRQNNLKMGDYLDLGHSAAKIEDSSEYLFNSPKLISTLFDIATSTPSNFVHNTINLNTATSIFTRTTGQLDYTVEVSRDFGNGFLRMFISIGGSIVVPENAVINQLRGAKEASEKYGTNKPTLLKLAAKFREINEKGVSGLFNSAKLARIIRNTIRAAGSPSMLDAIAHNITSRLQGTKTATHKSKAKATSSKKFTVTSSNKVLPAVRTKKPNISNVGRLLAEQNTSVSSLESLLRSSLYERIKANMGRGNEKDVLNFRTGRFARSASIERISISRAGMVSVFYNYMRNPYGTFSAGGRQEYPKTRDPKLLISKSIREIAVQAAVTRLRSVLV